MDVRGTPAAAAIALLPLLPRARCPQERGSRGWRHTAGELLQWAATETAAGLAAAWLAARLRLLARSLAPRRWQACWRRVWTWRGGGGERSAGGSREGGGGGREGGPGGQRGGEGDEGSRGGV